MLDGRICKEDGLLELVSCGAESVWRWDIAVVLVVCSGACRTTCLFCPRSQKTILQSQLLCVQLVLAIAIAICISLNNVGPAVSLDEPWYFTCGPHDRVSIQLYTCEAPVSTLKTSMMFSYVPRASGRYSASRMSSEPSIKIRTS